MTRVRFFATGAALMGALALTACQSTAVRVGGAPQLSVQNCVAASARELKVPVAAIEVVNSTSSRDGVYAVNLAVGPQRRSAVCSVDENGTVGGVVYKRPE